MINTFKLNQFSNTNLFNYLVPNLLPFSSSGKIEVKNLFSTAPSTIGTPRACITPQSIQIANIFAPDTIPWLRSLTVSTSHEDTLIDCTRFHIPQLGITNRPLPGHKKPGFNLFKTLAKVIVPANAKNLDHCTVEFGQRLPLSAKAFGDELERQLSLLNLRAKRKGRLIFYSHTTSNLAVTSDFESLRFSALQALPVINVDWLDPENTWEIIWNPCSNLIPIKKQLTIKLIKFVNELINRVCASNCNLYINRPNYFFDTVYLPYRNQCQLPKLNKIISCPPSASATSLDDSLKATS